MISNQSKLISAQNIKMNTSIPFKDHAYFSILLDILSRKNSHHAVLYTEFSSAFYIYFLEAFALYLNQAGIPPALQGIDFIYLQESVLPQLNEASEKYNLIACSKLTEELKPLLTRPNVRLILLTQEKHSELAFTPLNIPQINAADTLAILNLQRTELEEFHQVIIPDELLNHAYALAQRYLNQQAILEQSLLLLDSSAARTRPQTQIQTENNRPIMTSSILTKVLSTWTHIPASNLHPYKFKPSELLQQLQQKIFGQDAALMVLTQVLQQFQAQNKASSACGLLFAGPEHSGKNASASAIAEQLFKQIDLLYIAQPMQTVSSILDMKFQNEHEKKTLALRELAVQTPYAVILYEQIEAAPLAILNELYEILSTGRLSDAHGHVYHFKQMLIILSTSLISTQLATIQKSILLEEEASGMDLLQLVMREQTHAKTAAKSFAPHEIAAEITPQIMQFLPSGLCQHLHIVPFLPLTRNALEKIIQAQLAQLDKTLRIRYEIALSYAPEAIRYLTNESLKMNGVENALKQLYLLIDQTILQQIENRNRSNQLFLQLNERGQALRCDWFTVAQASAED